MQYYGAWRDTCSLQGTGAIFRPTNDAYKAREKDGFAASPLTRQECTEIMGVLCSVRSLTFVVIDALDECDPSFRDEILEALEEIADNSTRLFKILISGQEDRGIHCHLEAFPNITIRTGDNRNDTGRSMDREVDNMIISPDLEPFIK